MFALYSTIVKFEAAIDCAKELYLKFVLSCLGGKLCKPQSFMYDGGTIVVLDWILILLISCDIKVENGTLSITIIEQFNVCFCILIFILRKSKPTQ